MTTGAERKEKMGQNEGKSKKKSRRHRSEDKIKGKIRGNRTRERRAKEGVLSLVAEVSYRHHLLTGAGLQAGFSRSQISVYACVRERRSQLSL